MNTIGTWKTLWQGVELPLRIQDEVACRHCDVHCEKVVYPGACLRMACPFVYAYEAWGHTYVGCMQKIYDVEIDLDLLEEAESGAAASAPCGRGGRRCRCARSRSSGRIRTARTSSAAASRSSTSFRASARRFRVFARVATTS